jgi:hypothetical protein
VDRKRTNHGAWLLALTDDELAQVAAENDAALGEPDRDVEDA